MEYSEIITQILHPLFNLPWGRWQPYLHALLGLETATINNALLIQCEVVLIFTDIVLLNRK